MLSKAFLTMPVRMRILLGFGLLSVVCLKIFPSTNDTLVDIHSSTIELLGLSSPSHVKHACLDSIELQRELLLSSYKQSFENVTHIALVDYPDHNNAGDAAIALGELLLLETLGIEIRYICTFGDFNITEMDASLSDVPRHNTAVALHGGGNMGNIWVDSQLFRVELIPQTLDRKIRSFPQTYEFFEPTESMPNQLLADSQAVYSRHLDLELVGRDTQSYKQIAANFPGHTVKLLPDIAVMIGSLPFSATTPRQMRFANSSDTSEALSPNYGWPPLALKPQAPMKDAVVLARNDNEGGQDHQDIDWKMSLHPFEVDLIDWSDDFEGIILDPKRGYSDNHDGTFLRYWTDVARIRVEKAMDVLLSGTFVITDRLHAHVMSTLLGIGHVVVDEGDIRKIQRVHDTWYSACGLPFDMVASSRFRMTDRSSDANGVLVSDTKAVFTSAMSLLAAGSENRKTSYSRVVEQGDLYN